MKIKVWGVKIYFVNIYLSYNSFEVFGVQNRFFSSL